LRPSSAHPFAASDIPLIRTVLLDAGQDAALILFVHHAIADGMSLAYAIRASLSALAGDILAPLPPTPSADDLPRVAQSSAAPARTNETPQGQESTVPMRWHAQDDARPSVSSLALPRALTARLRTVAAGQSLAQLEAALDASPQNESYIRAAKVIARLQTIQLRSELKQDPPCRRCWRDQGCLAPQQHETREMKSSGLPLTGYLPIAASSAPFWLPKPRVWCCNRVRPWSLRRRVPPR
jgi:hypothetical protein